MAEDKRTFLTEHLQYEYSMLASTFALLSVADRGLFYNIFYESFIIHGRNLYQFLRSNDSGNYKARDFSQKFSPSNDRKDSWLQKIDKQVFHMGKKRPTTSQDKFSRSDAKELFEWINKNYKDFLKNIDEEYKSLIHKNSDITIPDTDNSTDSASSSIITISGDFKSAS